MAKPDDGYEQSADSVDQLFTGRRSFDRQMHMLTIAVNTMQRDFLALEERVRGIQQLAIEVRDLARELEDELHKLDKALVTRIATITVGERVLWLVVAALIALGGKFLV